MPMPVDSEGPRVEVARLLAASALVRLAYVVPTYHNPTGATMPEGRRRELATAAAELGFHVVEDLTPDTSLGLDVPRPIASFDEADRVITLGSLSKIAWGGLRIGWIRTPRADIDRLVAGKIVADHATSLITQAIAARVLDRVDDVVSCVRRPPNVEPLSPRPSPRSSRTGRIAPEGGLSLWVGLPDADAVQFSRLAARHGVIVRPGPLASPDGGSVTTSASPMARNQTGWSKRSTAWRAPGRSTHPRTAAIRGHPWPSASNPAPRRIGLAIVAAPPWGSARPAPPPAG